MNRIEILAYGFQWDALIDIATDKYDEVEFNQKRDLMIIIHANGKRTCIEWDGSHVSCLKSDEDFLEDLIVGARETGEWVD